MVPQTKLSTVVLSLCVRGPDQQVAWITLNSNLFNEHKAHYVSVKDSLSDLPDINDNWRISKMPYKQNNQLSDYQRRIRNGSNFVYNNICRLSNDDAKEMFKYLKITQWFQSTKQYNVCMFKETHHDATMQNFSVATIMSI